MWSVLAVVRLPASDTMYHERRVQALSLQAYPAAIAFQKTVPLLSAPLYLLCQPHLDTFAYTCKLAYARRQLISNDTGSSSSNSGS